MSVGIYVKGSSSTPGWIDRIRDELAGFGHPAAEGVDVSDDGVVSASTTPVGPGYHVALCEELDRLGRELDVEWDLSDDDIGWLESRDTGAVEREMLQWLQTVVRVVLEQGDVDDVALSMSMDHRYRCSGVTTPTGPRDRAWLEAVAEDPQRGIDFFPWWSPGHDAPERLGRALCLMWTDVRWRAPVTDDEEDLLDAVIALLDRAWELDPTLPYPAREWVELADITCDEVPDEIAEQAEREDGPRIGYRREPVWVSVRGWRVQIPGEFAEEDDADGSWCAWHDGRTVWLSTFRIQTPDGQPMPAERCAEQAPGDGPPLERRDGELVGRGWISPGDDGFTLSARSAVDGRLALVTIVFPTEDDRDWALETWATVRPD